MLLARVSQPKPQLFPESDQKVAYTGVPQHGVGWEGSVCSSSSPTTQDLGENPAYAAISSQPWFGEKVTHAAVSLQLWSGEKVAYVQPFSHHPVLDEKYRIQLFQTIRYLVRR